MTAETIDQADHVQNDGYERDFYSWTHAQAALIREGRLAEIDAAHVAEELETLGRGQINALRSRYAVLCLHLLKMTYQPERLTRSWRLTVAAQRIEIARLLADNPGLKPKRPALFAQGYEDGRKLAIVETDLSPATFPVSPTFDVAQAEDEAWNP